MPIFTNPVKRLLSFYNPKMLSNVGKYFKQCLSSIPKEKICVLPKLVAFIFLFAASICWNSAVAQTHDNVTIVNNVANGGAGTTNGAWLLAAGTYTFTPNAANATVSVDDIVACLTGSGVALGGTPSINATTLGNVTINTTVATGGGQNGDITVASLVSGAFTVTNNATSAKTLTFLANGNIAINSPISLSGANILTANTAGDPGDNIILTATAGTGNITISGSLTTIGGNGGQGTTSSAGAGASGGAITMTGNGTIGIGTITTLDSLVTRGGFGGVNTAAHGGGNGGAGGAISITSNASSVTVQGNSGFSTMGGYGGSMVAPGGGGNGGTGGVGGAISVTATTGVVTIQGNSGLNASGGTGGDGYAVTAGNGGAGGNIGITGNSGIIIGSSSTDSIITRGGNGGNFTSSKAGGAGVVGGSITLSSSSGFIMVNGNGGFVTTGGNGGIGDGSGTGAGGAGGVILIGSTTGTGSIVINPTLNSSGGNGGGIVLGAATPGAGGIAGTVSILSSGTISSDSIISNGGAAGTISAGLNGIKNGGNGGIVTITSTSSSSSAITINDAINTIGGIGTTDAGSTGGAGGNGGNAAVAINITASNGGIITNGILSTQGGAAGSTTTSSGGGLGGAGEGISLSAKTVLTNALLNTTGGAGGVGATSTGGTGGLGGHISITGVNSVTTAALSANGGPGGASGAGGGTGGAVTTGITILSSSGSVSINGIVSAVGGNGGSGIASTGGGAGNSGAISITGSTGITVGTLSTDNDSLITRGNAGGNSSAGGGAGGVGGNINLASTSGSIIINGIGGISSAGGVGGSGSGSTAGAGGAATGTITIGVSTSGVVTINPTINSNGGTGGTSLGNSAGGIGGVASTISITAPGSITLFSAVTAQGGVGGSTILATGSSSNGGKGGNAAAITINSSAGSVITNAIVSTNGGSGGNVANAAKTVGTGGNATTISITGATGVTANQNISAIAGLKGTGGGGGANGTAANIAINDGASTVTSGGNNAGVSGVISGANFSTSGTGILKLSAANIYTGTTTVTGDTLQIGIAAAIPLASNVTLNGGTISTAGGIGGAGISNGLLGTLTATGTGSAITLGTGVHTIKFANSTGVFGSGPLVINNWLTTPGVSGTAGQVYIGTTSPDLSPAQLQTISFKGYCGTAAEYVSPGTSNEIVPSTYSPALTGVVQTPIPTCPNSAATINLSGVTPGTYTVAYSIAGVTQTPVTGVVANSSGNASFTTTNVTTALNGSTLQIISLTNGTCVQTFSGPGTNTTLSIYPTLTLSGVAQVSGPTCNGSTGTITLSGLLAGTYTVNYTINGVAQTTVVGVTAAFTTASFTTAVLTSAMNGTTLQITSLNNGTCTQTFSGAGTNTTVSVSSLTLGSVTQATIPACIKTAATIDLTGMVAGTYTLTYSINGVTQTPVTGLTVASTTGTFTTSTLTAALNGTSLQILSLNNGTCTQNFTIGAAGTFCTLSVYTSIQWVGGTTDWNTATNWCGGIPDSTTDVTIPTATNYPSLDATLASGNGVGAAKSITINSGASLTVTGTGILSIAGSTITNSGTFNAITGTIRMCGTAQQTLDASVFLSHTVNNLIICNNSTTPSVQLKNTAGDTLWVTNSVSFGALNNSKFETNGNLTLVSTVSNTANIADITNGNTNTGNAITGMVEVERYFPAHRSWRLVTAPISSTSAPTINTSWQEGYSNVSKNTPLYSVGADSVYGTIITKTTSQTNGYDPGSTSNPSLYYYTGSGWTAPGATNSGAITDEKGYMLFVRGNRDYVVTNQYAAPTATRLRVKGNLNENEQNIGGTGFTVIGNPYASTVYYDSIGTLTGSGGRGSNIPAAYYMWDPLMTGSNGVGAFIALSKNPGAHSYTPSVDPSTVNLVGSPGHPVNTTAHSIDEDGRIQSGQAILIDFNDGVNPALGSSKVEESDKVSNASDNYAFRPAAPLGGDTLELFRGNLYAENSDSSVSLEDGDVVMYNNGYSNAVDYLEDVRKLGNFAETMTQVRNNKYLAIEKRKIIGFTDTVYYGIYGMKQKNYILELVASNLNHPGLSGFLIDSFTQTRTPLNLNGATEYPFTVNSTAASSAPARFNVIFVPAAADVPLPVTFTAVKATEQTGSSIAVQWNVSNPVNIKQYQIQKSTDGTNFTTVNTTTANANTTAYAWLDANAIIGNNYYRIIGVGNDGTLSYSQQVKVNIGAGPASIAVYPNPVSNGVIGLELTNMPAGKYSIRLIDNIGQVLLEKEITHATGSALEPISFNKGIAKGVYHLEVTGPDGFVDDIKIIY